jgi:hypothetical protein
LTYKVNTDGGDVGLGVGVIGESQQQTRLSNTGVTDEEELEEVVVSGVGGSGVSAKIHLPSPSRCLEQAPSS